MKTTKQIVIAAVFLMLFSSCGDTADNDVSEGQSRELDIARLEQVLGMKGTTNDGPFKITAPQNDLNVTVDSFKIIPPMGLGSWAAFTSSSDGAMVMGDIVVTETDLKPVQLEMIRQGLTVTAIHNHFLRDKPHVNRWDGHRRKAGPGREGRPRKSKGV